MRQVRGVPRVLGVVCAVALTMPVLTTAAGAAAASGTAPGVARAAGAGLSGPAPDVIVRLGGDTHRDPAAGRGVRSWPGTKIRYWADLPASFDWPLQAAVKTWNATGMDMTFVRSSKAKAKLKITIGDTHGADGYATIGYQYSNWVRLRRGLVTPVPGEPTPYAKVVAAHIIAHELGHVLGLEHTSGCELMTPILELPTCSIMAGRIGYYSRITDRTAVKKTVARYGGRVALGPAALPLDPVPPRLGGVGFSGGFDKNAPVKLTWTPPRRAPAGSHVLLLVTNGKTCSYPVTRDYWGIASYSSSAFTVQRLLDPRKGSVTPSVYGVNTHCYALALVNRTGAGSAPQGKVLRSWVPAPPAPTVTSVRRVFDEQTNPGQYLVTLDYDSARTSVVFLARPQGQCATAWPTGESYADHQFYGSPGTPYVASAYDGSFQPIANACLTFFTVRLDGTRHSSPVTYQVDVEPPPEAPVVHGVTLVGQDLYSVDATYDDVAAGLAVVVSPTGACVDSWPVGQDPKLALVYGVIDTTGYPSPCLAFFTVNAMGGTTGPVQVQTAP